MSSNAKGNQIQPPGREDELETIVNKQLDQSKSLEATMDQKPRSTGSETRIRKKRKNKKNLYIDDSELMRLGGMNKEDKIAELESLKQKVK